MTTVGLYYGENLLKYSFPGGHSFNRNRVVSFWEETKRLGLLDRMDLTLLEPELGVENIIELFHTEDYVAFVRDMSELGSGVLDNGDTPAFKGVFEAASYVVGSVVDALQRVMRGQMTQCFIPVAGLHHARRSRAAGFCVFNDVGVAIMVAKKIFSLERILYVDIDAHHGDGVFYEFQDDPEVMIADIHEDGRYIYPGTGHSHETGRGQAEGSKLNIPLPPGSDDAKFMKAFAQVEEFALKANPQLILLQCGADGLAGDPLAHLMYSRAAHIHATERLNSLAQRFCGGKMLALGGGGYNEKNTATAWTSVLRSLADTWGEMPVSPGYL